MTAPPREARADNAAERTIYTPGSRSGVPLAILRSFAAPPAAVREDEELLRDRIQASVSGLLALLGIEADPIRSREHILLSTILDHAWRAGRSLDLASLIAEIQSPPFEKVGVFNLESFFDADKRFELWWRVRTINENANKEVIAAMEVAKKAGEGSDLHAEANAFINKIVPKGANLSQIANERVENVSDHLSEGEEVRVKVLDVDQRGRIKLSIKELLEDEAPAAEEAPVEETAPAAE